MIIARTSDIKKDFNSLCLKAEQGERVLITRPKQKNLILISEEEYTRLEARKSLPQDKFDILSGYFGIAKGNGLEGKSDKDILAEELVKKYCGLHSNSQY
ncbi:MAG: hypothetical protein FWG90_00480 [Oscillospiraceae bacterium]|nr:hypothetical protein [Oscillospiraceae bacterium]